MNKHGPQKVALACDTRGAWHIVWSGSLKSAVNTACGIATVRAVERKSRAIGGRDVCARCAIAWEHLRAYGSVKVEFVPAEARCVGECAPIEVVGDIYGESRLVCAYCRYPVSAQVLQQAVGGE